VSACGVVAAAAFALWLPSSSHATAASSVQCHVKRQAIDGTPGLSFSCTLGAAQGHYGLHVPTNTQSVDVDATGGAGGSAGSHPGGRGAEIDAPIAVNPGDDLSIYVGATGAGGSSSHGGSGGSGSLVRSPGGGVVIAAGGGGGAGTAHDGSDAQTSTDGGAGGWDGTGTGPAQGGTNGADGEDSTGANGAAGGLGAAQGATGGSSAFTNGGGGGGYSGGGGGGAGNNGSSGGGGGSYSGSTPTLAQVTNTSAGSVTVSWNLLTVHPSVSTGLGGPLSLTAILSSENDPTNPSVGTVGTLHISLFGPNDVDCHAPLFTQAINTTGDGSYTTDPYTPTTAGAYRWRVGYKHGPGYDVEDNLDAATSCIGATKIQVASPTPSASTSTTPAPSPTLTTPAPSSSAPVVVPNTPTQTPGPATPTPSHSSHAPRPTPAKASPTPTTTTHSLPVLPISFVPSPSPTPSPTHSASHAPPSPSATPTPNGGGPLAAGPISEASTPGKKSLDAPSFLTNHLTTFADIRDHPELLLQAVGYSLVWVLGIAIIVQLLSETLSHQYEKMSDNWHRKYPSIHRGMDFVTQWFNGSNVHAIIAVLVTNAIVMALVDPSFGFNALSLRVLAATIIIIGLVSAGSNLIAAGIAKRYWGTQSTLNATGLSLVLAVGGMTLSRLLHFIPGLLEGNAFDLDARDDESLRDAVRLEVLCGWVLLAMAAIGWTIAVLWTPAQTAPQLLFHDVAAGICAGALGNLFIALLPLPVLRGGLLIRHARREWIAQSLITTVAFVVIVAPKTTNWLQVHSFLRWLTIALCFLFLAVGAIIMLNRRAHHASRMEAAEASDAREPEPTH
jgi:hypothetical protein